jgi:hypothetical protein
MKKARAQRVILPQVISHVFATCLPRFGQVFAVSSCNVFVKVSQCTHQVFARCLPGGCDREHCSRHSRRALVVAKAACNLPHICNAFAKVSQCTQQFFARCLQGACDQKALLAPLESSARHRRKAASYLPHICNVLAKVWKWLRTDILQSICNGFT